MQHALILLAIGAFLEGFERYSSWPKGKEWWRIPVGIFFTYTIANFSPSHFWEILAAIGLGVPLGGITRLIWSRAAASK